ncbi:MAG: cell envelope integrity protein TolA [Halioglobus sp.]
MSSAAARQIAAPRIVVRPLLITLLLHGLMLAALMVNLTPEKPKVVKVKPAPKVINARLVDVSEFQPKPKPKAKPKPPTKPKPVVKKPVVKEKPKPVVKEKPKPKPKPAVVPTPKVEPKQEPKPVPRITPAELAALARAELADAAAEEQTATAEEMAASYAALIRQTVEGYWSRPPSARNGMEVLLAIKLIPTGEVVSVSIVQSSGNTAFDRSAVNAVNKAGAFPELQKLPTREFERTFRRFSLLFRPEDLRY